MATSLRTYLKTPAALAIAGLGLAASMLSAAPARAIGALPVLYGTGLDGSGSPVTPTPNSPSGLALDSNWKIAQLPNAAPSNTGSLTPNTGAYLPYDVANPWIGSSCQTSSVCGVGGFGSVNDNTGATIAGVNYRWISASNTDRAFSTSISANATTPSYLYSYILKQTFTATAGGYFVGLSLTADNAVSYYIGGTIDTTDPLNPTITGGTLIGRKEAGSGGLSQLIPIVGYANLVDGVNTAYMVVSDNQIVTGVIATSANFDTSVPGPLPLLGAGAAFGWSRRLRRRLAGAESSAN